MYTWGSGEYGKLGHGSEEKSLMPALVEALQGKGVIQVPIAAIFIDFS